jgi:hypothetical protein
MARRRKNPSPLTMLLVAGAAALGGYGIYRVLAAPENKKAAPSGKEQPKKKTQGKYAGTGWTAWPHKNWFDTLDSLGQGLDFAGYPVVYSPFKPRSADSIAQVKQFQRDWNAVYAAHIASRGAVGYRLDVDGKLGSQTIEALYWVTQLVADYDSNEWQSLVAEARKVLKES